MAGPANKRATHRITPNSDFPVTVLSRKDLSGKSFVRYFSVDKDALITHSRYFKASFRFNDEHGSHAVYLKDDGLVAMHIWFIYLHNAGSSTAADTDNDSADEALDQAKETRLFTTHAAVTGKVGINEIWDIILAADKYDFNPTLLRGFFQQWYSKNIKLDDDETEDARDLARRVALPCCVFDHVNGFAEVTKWLAYNSRGHISEKRPEGFKFDHLHLAPPDFVGPMNAIRGRLKTELHKCLWERVGRLLKEGKHSCTCVHAPESAGLFLSALVDLNAYPLELIWPKNSVNEVLSLLSRFTPLRTGRCEVCRVDWKPTVDHAVKVTEGYFQGLCLDCMKRSRLPRGKDPDKEYWSKNGSIGGRWDTHCRFKHGQPTWYHSFIGRDEHRQTFVKHHREEKRDLGL